MKLIAAVWLIRAPTHTLFFQVGCHSLWHNALESKLGGIRATLHYSPLHDAHCAESLTRGVSVVLLDAAAPSAGLQLMLSSVMEGMIVIVPVPVTHVLRCRVCQGAHGAMPSW